METVIERRACERKPLKFAVKYFYFPPEANPPITRTIDLTLDGALIEALDPFQQGASVAFFIVTPEHQVVDVRAKVIHGRVAESAPFYAGVRFTHISAGDRAVLQQAIGSVVRNYS